MAQAKAILNKIERNLKQLGMSVSRDASNNVVAAGITISYVDASIQAPMGGISGDASPFLGIGIANPGKLSLDTDPTTLAQFKVLRVCCAFANNIAIPSGELPGSVDLLNLGQ